MKILFLCGSAEPGKDGVGDYTRRLCGQLIRTGQQAQILSLCDKQATSFVAQTQLIEEIAVTVRRIPIGSSCKQRLTWTQEVLKEEAPDWISLQFVPFSFNPRGLPFWLPNFLKTLKGNHQSQIMFHELWVGIEKEAPFKYKLAGVMQKQILQKIKKSLDPKVVHTQAKIYQYYLSKSNITAGHLPLFGNVSVSAIKKEYSESMVFVVFATIHDSAPFEDFILDLKRVAQQEVKELKFVFIGRNGELLDTWTNILDQYGIEYELLGQSSEQEISQQLINADYGISCTPYKISDKSGVVAAMREHKLSIINVAKPWRDQDDITLSFSNIIQYQKGNLILKKGSEKGNNSLTSVCDIFLKSLKN
jgi:hypothetical protein